MFSNSSIVNHLVLTEEICVLICKRDVHSMFTNSQKQRTTSYYCVVHVVLYNSVMLLTGCSPVSPLFINTTCADHFLLTSFSLCSSASFTLHFHIGNFVHKQIVPRVKPIIFSSILRKTKIVERAWNEIVILHYYPHSRPSFVPIWSVNEATPFQFTQFLFSHS